MFGMVDALFTYLFIYLLIYSLYILFIAPSSSLPSRTFSNPYPPSPSPQRRRVPLGYYPTPEYLVSSTNRNIVFPTEVQTSCPCWGGGIQWRKQRPKQLPLHFLETHMKTTMHICHKYIRGFWSSPICSRISGSGTVNPHDPSLLDFVHLLVLSLTPLPCSLLFPTLEQNSSNSTWC